jgi:uncharacterized protein (TIGR03437 family)
MLRLVFVAFISLASVSLRSQVLDSVIASGYLVPIGAAVAPGQVLSLYVQEVGASLTAPVFASSVPLPTSLADISILLQESHGRGSADHFLTVPVPIFAIVPFSSCAGTSFGFVPDRPGSQLRRCKSFVAITVQVPFEIQPTEIGTPDDALENYGIEFIISEKGLAKAAVVMNTYKDQIHVVTDCDINHGLANNVMMTFDRCQTLVFHADGTSVRLQPARPGEELVMYALGLGKTTPTAQTGQASPPAATVPVQLRFDFTPDARPKLTFSPPQNNFLRFAGLSPGSVGLYQVNFKVPRPPPGTPFCPVAGASSNLTVTITGEASFDGAAICVEVGQ